MQKIDIPFISEIMEKNVINKISNTSINKFKDEILDSFIEGALFIVGDNDKLMGVVTDGDVRKNCSINQEYNIEDIITWNPKKISAKENASIALRILREEQINILPVVDDNESLVGYISLHMLLNHFSPERLYISEIENISDNNEKRHLARYKFALNFIKKDGYTLDCACGSGYGSRILNRSASKVLGIDLSHDAISFAKKNNALNSIEFKQSDLNDLRFENAMFDTIVSIETLEHVPNSVFLKFLENIEKWLKNGGVFIGSSPMLRYKDGKPYITNPYHINEMAKNDFINAVNSKLKNFQIHYYYQDQNIFLPLCEENSGFCIVIARKKTD